MNYRLEVMDTATFLAEARRWLDAHAVRRPAAEAAWGEGSESVAVFDNVSEEQEREQTAAICAWERLKFDEGWGAVGWPEEYGGRGLPQSFAHLFAEEEAAYDVPRRNELFAVTQHLVAPTILKWGTDEQRQRFVRALLRTDVLACQLFSEPGAGSDLAGVATKAVRDGDDWVLTGQKVWTSAARVAHIGEAICRSDPDAPKHAGLTAFLVPLDAPGVTVRPIRQMTGGETFNEVFLDEVRVPDAMRLGPEGSGWQVALTTLAAERFSSGSLGEGTLPRVVALARHLERTREPVVRQRLADLWVRSTIQRLTHERVAHTVLAGAEPGPEASIGKLFATEFQRDVTACVSLLLGPRLAADTGEWGTYCWTEHVLGAPGYRIAGGSDEIQRTIIGERVLGLPREPRP